MRIFASKATPTSADLALLLDREHFDPHRFLGLHLTREGKVARLFRPGAKEIHIEVQNRIEQMHCVHESGLFELPVPSHLTAYDYRVFHQNTLLANDPYAFLPTWGELDSYLFSRGVHYKLFDALGAHPTVQQGVAGIKFAVWAPRARSVFLVGDFNYWDGRVNPMRSMGVSGVWELFVPGLSLGERYKFEIKTEAGEVRVKADPYAHASELRPATASVVADVNSFAWADHAWRERRATTAFEKGPMNIYEVHLGSWKRGEKGFLNYREIAFALCGYCKEMGYTHVELLGVMEHPLDESWGYQVTGYFAPTSRFGTPADFQFLVDHFHQEGIGVLLDWVPGHFPTDDFALAHFDGSHLYEHLDPRQGFHPHWNTYIFNYGRHEVSNFLMASALFWMEKMHIDGLRVDAVASMLYLDYGRAEGEWIANRFGGRDNIEAIEFLKHLNSIIHQTFPGVLMIAEESTAFPAVTRPVAWEGLGFDFKWNMGWMNDTLRYFHKDSLFRSHHQNDLTFGLLYAFSEKFILVLSHDEVVHGKGSLLSKMPGDYWQKFANLRLLLTYLMTQPGKKMLFMGGEVGQWSEWWCQEQIHWHLLNYPIHSGLHALVKEINHLYLAHPQLWEHDCDYTGFEWVDFSDTRNSVISYKRKNDSPTSLLCVHNFTPTFHSHYHLSLPHVKSAKEIFNSDEERFGGSGKKNTEVTLCRDKKGEVSGMEIVVAPLATHLFEINY